MIDHPRAEAARCAARLGHSAALRLRKQQFYRHSRASITWLWIRGMALASSPYDAWHAQAPSARVGTEGMLINLGMAIEYDSSVHRATFQNKE
eukprot:1159854-Pelagomonas_calceolata.AAC.4